ncbi:MAG: LTA synthase family protein [Oscillospiraceae bacterium]|nr:LTA synthase family protein [Oscillospiraceae bacterium]
MLNKIKATLTERDKCILLVTSCYVLSCLLLGILTFVLIAHESEFSEIFYNSLFTIGLFSLVLIISRRFIVSFPVVCAVLVFFYYLDTYVYHSRLTHIQYHDVYCIGDALSVSSNYPLVIDLDIVLDIVLTVSVCMLYVVLVKSKVETPEYTHKKNMVAGATGLAFVILLLGLGCLPIEEMDFDMNGYTERKGLFYTWYSQYRNSFVEKPQGYSAEKADKILDEYDLTSLEDDPVNVIVIMNEAFADYSIIGDIELQSDPLSNYHSINDNCIKGRCGVSVYGGYTCNSEFEFLTGYSMAFLPRSSLPYIQYINTDTATIASDMHQAGYRSTIIHPYFAQEYRRPYIYSYFGFDDYISGEDFSDSSDKETYDNITSIVYADFGDDLEYIRGFISDGECYDRIYETVKNDNESGKNSFVFAITMQNHGGYTTPDFESIKFLDGDHDPENEYLTSLYYSDIAFGELIEKLESYHEKTVVLMFGDHQPGLPNISQVINTEHNVGDYYKRVADKYTVPYIMWANYDVDWKDRGELSINYLSAVLKQNAGIPLSSWDQFRLSTAEQYPVITANFAVNSKKEYLSVSSVENDVAVQDYRLIQYRKMFDR